MEIPQAPVRQRAAVKRSIALDVDPLQPVQARAHATRDALLAAGRAMLADGDFDSLSIADLAAASKLSVGSFYGRFRDKEAFFEQLQEQVTAEFLLAARQALLPKDGQASTAGAIVASVCAMVIDGFRKDAGYVRAALRHASTQPASWSPIQSAGRQVVKEVITRRGAWYFFGDHKWQGMEAVVASIREEMDLREELERLALLPDAPLPMEVS